MESTIYSEMISYRGAFPRNLFVGSDERIQALQYAMQAMSQ